MTATVVPFPRTRHRRFVQRQASLMVQYSEAAAGKHLAQQIELQRRTMQRRGVNADLIGEHLRELEGVVILAELWEARRSAL